MYKQDSHRKHDSKTIRKEVIFIYIIGPYILKFFLNIIMKTSKD